MIPPQPSPFSDAKKALLAFPLSDFLASLPPEDPPFWFAHIWHDPSCILLDFITEAQFPLWLQELRICSEDNAGLPIPQHLLKATCSSPGSHPSGSSD